MNEKAYQTIYAPLIEKLECGRCFPNIPAIKKEIREWGNKADKYAMQANFVNSLEEVDKISDAVAVCRGYQRAYQDILKYIKDRIKKAQ